MMPEEGRASGITEPFRSLVEGEGPGETDLLSEIVVVGESGRLSEDFRQPKKPVRGDFGFFESDRLSAVAGGALTSTRRLVSSAGRGETPLELMVKGRELVLRGWISEGSASETESWAV